MITALLRVEVMRTDDPDRDIVEFFNVAIGQHVLALVPREQVESNQLRVEVLWSNRVYSEVMLSPGRAELVRSYELGIAPPS